MCGIAGVLAYRKTPSPQALSATALAMTRALAHRGPDDEGTWSDPACGVALGHRRLSVLDLSPLGHQPMMSRSGRYVMVYNGETYNFADIAAELAACGVILRGRSDTEALLAAIDRWGVEAALARASGMLAFAVWDRAQRVLHLARDRAGKKPLYVADDGAAILFGSELKALRAAPGFSPQVDRAAVAALMQFGHIPAPLTIHRGVVKLPAATLLSLPLTEGRVAYGAAGLIAAMRGYWSLRETAERGQAAPFRGDDAQAVETLDGLLRAAVTRRMVSDAPLGAFLSGGVDSSLVTAMMARASDRPVRSFCVGFSDRAHDETGHARAMAAHLGTDHTEIHVSDADAAALVPRLAQIYDEPFADASQIPTWHVCNAARAHVTVALTGDGGDEAFGGYKRHASGARIMAVVARAPAPARRALARALALGAASGSGRDRLAAIMAAPDADAAYLLHAARGRRFGALMLTADDLSPPQAPKSALRGALARMGYMDMAQGLPEGVLAKLDRASMSVGLEARSPLLDDAVTAFAWTLPNAMKRRGGEGKWILRRVLDRYAPPALHARPKQGFTPPLGSWLRGPLRDWASGLLDARRLASGGLLDAEAVARLWADHLTGRRDHARRLWPALMLEAWGETRESW